MLDKHTIEYSNNNYVNSLEIILKKLNLWDTPTTFDNSLSWYQALKYVLEYMINNVIPPLEENEAKLNELITYYNEVVDYVNNYFENLDVQQEINNKLDDMSTSGELTNLIKSYVDPIQENFENYVNNKLSVQNTKINALESGSPLVASSVADMTDTGRVYVNTTDGYWYWYNGTNWVQGGVYQATVINDDVITTEKIKKIFNNYDQNIFDFETSDIVEGKTLNSTTGVVTSSNSWSYINKKFHIPSENNKLYIDLFNLSDTPNYNIYFFNNNVYLERTNITNKNPQEINIPENATDFIFGYSHTTMDLSIVKISINFDKNNIVFVEPRDYDKKYILL